MCVLRFLVPIRFLSRPRQSNSRTVTATFAANGAEKTIEELRFRVPKSIELQADRITLGFIDGPLTWQLPANLKRF